MALNARERAQGKLQLIRATRRANEVKFAQLPQEEQERIRKLKQERTLKDQVSTILWDSEHGMMPGGRNAHFREVLQGRLLEIETSLHPEFAQIEQTKIVALLQKLNV